MMAAADRISIRIEGKGGHGAHPHLSVDPVVVAAHIITAAQSIVSRNVSPLQSAVVSLCSLQAGSPGAFSVIPGPPPSPAPSARSRSRCRTLFRSG